jgi:creatine kinase
MNNNISDDCITPELVGKQDPYVSLAMGPEWSHNTEVHEGAGDKSSWSPDLTIPVTSSFVKANALKLKVKDKNDVSSDKLIGKASVDGRSLMSRPSVWVDVGGDLLDTEGAVTGHFALKVIYRPDGYPLTDDKHESMMSKTLTPDMYEKLKGRETPGGVNLMCNIRSGVDVPAAEVGLSAGDADSYETFRELFDPVIGAYHGVDVSGADSVYSSNQDSSELDRTETIVYDYVVSSHIRCVRNVRGYPFVPSINELQRLALETALKNCLGEINSDFAGKYLSLSDMPDTEKNRLKSLDLMLERPPVNSAIDYSGTGKDWPRGRGVFGNGSTEFAIHINGTDHLCLVCQHQGGNIGAVFEDWISANNSLENALVGQSMSFVKSSRLGYLSSSPCHVGTGMRAMMVLRLASLGQNELELRAKCAGLGLRVRRHPSLENGWVVSNQATLGKTEVEIVQLVIDGVAALTSQEQDEAN